MKLPTDRLVGKEVADIVALLIKRGFSASEVSGLLAAGMTRAEAIAAINELVLATYSASHPVGGVRNG